MLIKDLKESTAIETSMKLRKVARDLRYGRVGYPKIFKYLKHRDDVVEIVLPTRNKWIKGIHPPRRIINDVAIHINVGARHPAGYVLDYYLTIPQTPKSDTINQVKTAVITFTKNLISELFKPIGGAISVFEFRHRPEHDICSVDYENFATYVNLHYEPYEKWINELYRADLINQFSDMVRTYQYAD